MPAVKRVLGSLRVEVAKRVAGCKRNRRHSVARGELRLIVKNPGPASGERPYCTSCGLEILAMAEADVERLRQQLLDRLEIGQLRTVVAGAYQPDGA